jgi:hypothetical protein
MKHISHGMESELVQRSHRTMRVSTYLYHVTNTSTCSSNVLNRSLKVAVQGLDFMAQSLYIQRAVYGTQFLVRLCVREYVCSVMIDGSIMYL